MKPECPEIPGWAWEAAASLRNAVVWQSNGANETIARALLDAHQRGRREAMEEAVCLISDLPLDIDPDIELPDFVNGADYAIGIASAAIRAKMEEQL